MRSIEHAFISRVRSLLQAVKYDEYYCAIMVSQLSRNLEPAGRMRS